MVEPVEPMPEGIPQGQGHEEASNSGASPAAMALPSEQAQGNGDTSAAMAPYAALSTPLPAELAEFDASDPFVSQARLKAVALPADVVRARKPPAEPRREVALHVENLPDALRTLLILPSICVLLAALCAAVVAVGSLVALIHRLVSLQFTEAVDQLPALDAAARVLLAAAGYFALLFAIRAIAAGMHAQGWERLRILAAVLLALPSAWLFVAGTGLAASTAPLSALPSDVWRVVVLALLTQLIALAVLTAREPIRTTLLAKTSRWASGRGARLSQPLTLDTPTPPMPMVRFGPSTDSLALTENGARELRVSGLLSNPPALHREDTTAEDRVHR